jgi:4-diphosphocytidyl-2C-methyl-D-erythritol kinase
MGEHPLCYKQGLGSRIFAILVLYFAGSKARCTVDLDKKGPCGAGLGGGSSNAATTLWAANHLAAQNVCGQSTWIYVSCSRSRVGYM